MKNPKVLYILIGTFCFLAIIAGVYAEFFVKDVDKNNVIIPSMNHTGDDLSNEKTQEELKEQFSNLFTNVINTADYDFTNIQKINMEKEIIYSAYDIQKQENTIKDAYAQMNTNLSAWVKSTYEYDYLSETQQDFINSLIPNLDWNEISKESGLKFVNAASYEQYIKDNKKVFKLINDKNYKILEIKPIRKIKRNGILTNTFISSYCVKYEKML